MLLYDYTPLKEILKRKLNAEMVAEKNINKVLEDEDIKILFLILLLQWGFDMRKLPF